MGVHKDGGKSPPPSIKSVTHILQWWNFAVILYLRKIGNIYESRKTLLEFNFLTFLESLKIVLINMVTILMILAKMVTPALVKIQIFWNKGYDVIISVSDATSKILSRDSNYIIDVVMWPKFGYCSISMRKSYHNLNFRRIWPEKTLFFEGWSWFKLNNLRLTVGTNLEFYTSMAKGLKLNIRKCCGLNPAFVEVTGGKLVEGGLFAPALTDAADPIFRPRQISNHSNNLWQTLASNTAL